MSGSNTSDHSDSEEVLDTNDWPGLHSLYKMRKYSALTLVVGSHKKEFFVHREILINGSELFEDKLFETEENVFYIPDLTELTVELVLEYLYAEKLPENLTIKAVTEAFIPSRKLFLDRDFYGELTGHICNYLRDPKHLFNSEPDASDFLQLLNRMNEIEEVAEWFAEILQPYDTNYKYHYKDIIQEMKKIGIAGDLFRCREMECDL